MLPLLLVFCNIILAKVVPFDVTANADPLSVENTGTGASWQSPSAILSTGSFVEFTKADSGSQRLRIGWTTPFDVPPNSVITSVTLSAYYAADNTSDITAAFQIIGQSSSIGSRALVLNSPSGVLSQYHVFSSQGSREFWNMFGSSSWPYDEFISFNTFLEISMNSPPMTISFKTPTVLLQGSAEFGIVSVEPEIQLSLDGGHEVILRGTNFWASETINVWFGAEVATCAFVSPEKLICTSPAQEQAGLYQITLQMGVFPPTLTNGFYKYQSATNLDAKDAFGLAMMFAIVTSFAIYLVHSYLQRRQKRLVLLGMVKKGLEHPKKHRKNVGLDP